MAIGLQLPLGSVYLRDRFLQVNFTTGGCSFKKKGTCTFCRFPAGRLITQSEIVEFLHSDIVMKSNISEILFGVQGSIFDKEEFPEDSLRIILNEVFNNISCDMVGFETHYSFVSKKRLDELKYFQLNSGVYKDIYIEMGMETSVKKYLELVNKKMNLEGLKNKVNLIHSYNFDTIINVLYGFPMLSEKENEYSLFKSIDFVLNTGSYAVVFPYNPIRKNEKSASVIKLLGLLTRYSNEELRNIQLAWYGDRQEAGLNLDHRVPNDCSTEVITFINQYNVIKEGRKEILIQFLKGF